MKNLLRVLAVLMCIALLAGCTEDTAPAETEPAAATDPLELYQPAAQALSAMENLSYKIEAVKTVTVGSDTYTEEYVQTLSYLGAGTDGMTASSDRSMDYDGYSVDILEYYADGTAYHSVGNSRFQGSMTGEAFLSRYAPAVLLDPSLYGSITCREVQGGTEITFGDASEAESWLYAGYTELTQAGGTAFVDSDGVLTESRYGVSYAYGGAAIEQTYTVTLTSAEVSQPGEPDDYLPLEDPDLPQLLEAACGYLSQAGTVSSTVTESLISQAAGVYRAQSAAIDMCGSGGKFLAKLEHDVTFIDYSRGGETISLGQTELYRNGSYTLSRDGAETKSDSSVSSADMASYITNMLVESVMLPAYLKEASATDLGSTYLLEFTCSEETAQLLGQIAAQTLFESSNLLNDLAESYRTLSMTAYLGMDKYTGLPTSAGFLYRGEHTIGGFQYELSYQMDQSFCLGSLTARESITGQAEAVTADTPQPTPLFYRVTGADGQEMYLLGTIHVGDIRTSNLPREIYDAFDASDALAVEFDIQAFDALAAEDEALQTIISEAYFYPDGSTLSDHIDAELADYALALTKAIGSYNQNTPYCRPYTLESAISGFYLQQSYTLTSNNGVDNRLLTRAKEAGKQILDVESGASQMAMLAGFTDQLQEMLLLSTAAGDAAEYWISTLELYEMWCQGDEEALRAALTTDTSMLTDEELALYEQYNNAMTVSRNEAMLEVATQYLESGQTVFYAVGLAHLISENGLVDTLREAGYTVVPVRYA